MYIKLLTVVGLVAVATAADLSVGVGGGRVIFEQNVTASPAIWRQVQNLTVNADTSDEVISRIVVIDNRPEKDGEANVVEGGEGKKNVTIELKSPAIFRGYDFTVKVFAAPDNVYSNSPISNNPKTNGLDTQNPQVPYTKQGIDMNHDIMQGHKSENNGDVILETPKPTATATTEATKVDNDNQAEINNPAIVGYEPMRQNRDTKGQKTIEQSPLPTPVNIATSSVETTKDVKTNVNTNKSVQEEHNDDFDKVIAPIFSEYSTQKTEGYLQVKGGQAHPIIPQYGGEDRIDVITAVDNDQRKVQDTTDKDLVDPIVKEEKRDENQATLKSNLSSTTAKTIVGQEKYGPAVIPMKITTETPKLPEKEMNLKHKHAVPMP